MEKEKMLILALSKIGRENGETVSMVYKELYDESITMLQFQSEYIQTPESDLTKKDKRIVRNEYITELFKKYRAINRKVNFNVFDYDMPLDLRVLERGSRVDKAIFNIVDSVKFISSKKVLELVKECM